jgi:SAM-dependent methyltransferase
VRRQLADLTTWRWDPTLYAGSAAYYARGRLPYPPALAASIGDALMLDGTQRLLDVGCGPGSLTVLLAPLVDEAIGIDADDGMVREANAHAAANTRFVRLRAEELPGGLGRFDVVTFAQSFHWLEQEVVARTVHEMLEPSGAVVHVGATTHRGEGNVPNEQIEELVRAYLGPVRRAGQGALPDGTPWWEADSFRAAGFRGPERIDVPHDRVFERTTDEVVAAVYSLSSAAPHLFAERLSGFDRDLRALLLEASPSGRFTVRGSEIGVTIWRR